MERSQEISVSGVCLVYTVITSISMLSCHDVQVQSWPVVHHKLSNPDTNLPNDKVHPSHLHSLNRVIIISSLAPGPTPCVDGNFHVWASPCDVTSNIKTKLLNTNQDFAIVV